MEDSEFREQAQQWLNRNPTPPPDTVGADEHVMTPSAPGYQGPMGGTTMPPMTGAPTGGMPQMPVSNEMMAWQAKVQNFMQENSDSPVYDNDDQQTPAEKPRRNRSSKGKNASKKEQIIQDLRRIDLLVARVRKNLGISDE